MSKFINKVKDAFHNFHLEQPGVGPGVGGQHGLGANECYTSSSGNQWQENKRPVVGARGSSITASDHGKSAATPRDSTSS
jgi:hypothetical protein